MKFNLKLFIVIIYTAATLKIYGQQIDELYDHPEISARAIAGIDYFLDAIERNIIFSTPDKISGFKGVLNMEFFVEKVGVLFSI